jgi:eukaryotic-like serine/threonine-protein kinase
MSLAAGVKLGPYEIVAPLGAGGMDEVDRARDTRLGREVAIKVLPQHLSSNPDLKARFEREAKAISALSHPNICHLDDIGSQSGTDYLVVELLEGETVAERLQKGPLPLKHALEYWIHIADALEKARAGFPTIRELSRGGPNLMPSAAASAAPSELTPFHGTIMTRNAWGSRLGPNSVRMKLSRR